LASAGETNDFYEPFNPWFHAGIALAMCFSILTLCALSVNLIERKCVRPKMQAKMGVYDDEDS
jgi:hypothetical protein